MKNLFDTDTYNEIISRVQKLSPDQQPLWGVMNPAQMLAHSVQAFKVPLSPVRIPRMFLGYILGPLMKHKLYNDSPWKRNLPTAPQFKIRDTRDFEKEKANLIQMVERFYKAGPDGITKYPHPMFGKFTPEQWGKAMFKHLDHHLTQFGV